jgi:predicted nucleic acid-binding protein
MIVYCDTSFLVSFLNEDDSNHKQARAMAEKYRKQPFLICEPHLIELPSAVRAATHRAGTPIPAHVARRVINRFDRAVNSRTFQSKPLADDLPSAISMARSLGETYGWGERHTAFDLWHLAAAWTLAAGVFLTFDRRQKKIAKDLGMA